MVEWNYSLSRGPTTCELSKRFDLALYDKKEDAPVKIVPKAKIISEFLPDLMSFTLLTLLENTFQLSLNKFLQVSELRGTFGNPIYLSPHKRNNWTLQF